MRRSKAPSVLNKTKYICNLVNNSKETELETRGSEPEDEQYNWGTKNHNGGKALTDQQKRIFNIVWRDVSKRKHKTWKGDGIIEVNLKTMKAFLKDETGKYMGCSTKFNVDDLEADFQMVIGGKEIELQNEIKDEKEMYDLRKRQLKVRNWGAEEWMAPDKQGEEERKPKGGFKYKPVLTLKQPELPKNCEAIFRKQKNWETNTKCYLPSASNFKLGTKAFSNCRTKPCPARSTGNIKRKEFICFIKPSELQQFLFQQVLDYLNLSKNYISIKILSKLDFKNVLRKICNHPSFVNHKSTTNELIHYLIPSLPEWSEMGPFDSGKLEYLQYFLHASSKVPHENCIILAKHTNTLNMLQGLTDYMGIKCFRLNTIVSEEIKSTILNEFTTDKNFMQVLLINSMETIKNVSLNSPCKKLIVFDDVSENIRILETCEKLEDFTIYYLVTAFSIEELLLLNDYNNESYTYNLLQELHNLSTYNDNICYVHKQIECQCFKQNYELIKYNKYIEFHNNWQHFINPFDDEFLKISFLEHSTENIVTIFYKTSY